MSDTEIEVTECVACGQEINQPQITVEDEREYCSAECMEEAEYSGTRLYRVEYEYEQAIMDHHGASSHTGTSSRKVRGRDLLSAISQVCREVHEDKEAWIQEIKSVENLSEKAIRGDPQ